MQESVAPSVPTKSKAELRRERRELQEAQRAAKSAAKATANASKNSTQPAQGPKKQEQGVSDAPVKPQGGQKRRPQKSDGHAPSTPRKDSAGDQSVGKGALPTSPQPTAPTKAPAASGGGGGGGSSGGQQALGVMRMDDPAHFKKSIRQLHKKMLQPRPQDPVRVNLFCHLSQPDKRVDVLGKLNLGAKSSIHPAFLALGVDVDEGRIVGSNRRCIEFLRAVVALISSFPWSDHAAAGVSLARAFHTTLDRHVTFLDQCRPLPVTVRNAVQFLKIVLNRMDSVSSPDEMHNQLIEAVGGFVNDRIRLAGKAIADIAADSIRPGELVCVFGHSTLVAEVLVTAWNSRTNNFSVLVVDSRPRCEGRRMFTHLRKAGIPCELVHIAALPMLAPKISLTLLGAHSLLSNGYVIGAMGTAQVANIVASVAHTPVLVCAETYKFWERAQSDAFEFNELGDPDDIWRGPRGTQDDWRKPREGNLPCEGDGLANWREAKNLRLLNLVYDVVPPELVSAVVTELGILPTTSVPVVLRVKQASGDTDCFVSPILTL
uniref:Translation initiation factor eIF2B subunit delta n=1 Tax=Mesocestoides corti TaxID=53468 RepID=A0A5K3F4G8_MESCO